LPKFVETFEAWKDGPLDFRELSLFPLQSGEENGVVERHPEYAGKFMVEIASSLEGPLDTECGRMTYLLGQMVDSGAAHEPIREACRILRGKGCPGTAQVLDRLKS
jgi:hypothetical protein